MRILRLGNRSRIGRPEAQPTPLHRSAATGSGEAVSINLASMHEDPRVVAGTLFPCTVAQRAHWKLSQEHPGDPTLNIAARWRLEGSVVPALLERSLQMIIERHEILRTRFVERDGLPVQLVIPKVPFNLRQINLAELPAEERPAAAAARSRQEACLPFDLARLPLLRVTLLRMEPGLCELLLTTHQLVGDFWSNGVLAQEMIDIYEALWSGRMPVLPAPELQFRNHASRQQAWLQGGGAEPLEAYWHRYLVELPDFHVPVDHAPLPEAANTGDIIGMPVPEALVNAARGLAQARGATFFMLGVATLATLLHRWTGAPEVVFGTQVTGRSDVGLGSLIGHLVNTVVLRTHVAAAPDFLSLLDGVRRTVGEALEHAAAPIEQVLQETGLERDAAGRRRSATAINLLFQRALARDVGRGSFSLQEAPGFSPGARYDLNLLMVEWPDGWRLSCEFDPRLFDRVRVDWLLRSFLRILELVITDPACRISSLTLADEPAPFDRVIGTGNCSRCRR